MPHAQGYGVVHLAQRSARLSHATAAEAAPRTGPLRPRRIRTDALSPDHRSRDIAPMPSDRQPPHMLLRRGRDLLLVTCWPRSQARADGQRTDGDRWHRAMVEREHRRGQRRRLGGMADGWRPGAVRAAVRGMGAADAGRSHRAAGTRLVALRAAQLLDVVVREDAFGRPALPRLNLAEPPIDSRPRLQARNRPYRTHLRPAPRRAPVRRYSPSR